MHERVTRFWHSLNWPKIVGETLIIVVGVFLGLQASNWNAARIERAETTQMLQNLKPETRNLIGQFVATGNYYRVTRGYADTAFAGWRREPRVSDRDFVIAAYQASQIFYSGVSGQTWSQIVGAERLHTIADRGIREDLSVLMTTDYTVLEKELFSDHRQHVRQVIPEDIQDAIRKDCGDIRFGGEAGQNWFKLAPNCTLALPDERFRLAAIDLRNRPGLIGELRWYLAAVASYLENVRNLEFFSRRLLGRIERM